MVGKERVLFITAAFLCEQLNVTWKREQDMTEKQTGSQKNHVENFAKEF